MVPVIRELWRLGFHTLACCQDVGEATEAVPDQADRALGYGADGFISFHRGWALIELPLLDAMRLVDLLATEPLFAERVARRWRPGAWRMNVPWNPTASPWQRSSTSPLSRSLHLPASSRAGRDG